MGSHHPFLATDAALPCVPTMSQTLRTERVPGGIMRGHYTLALTLTAWHAWLVMPFVTPAAGRFTGKLVPVDICPFFTADVAGLLRTRTSLAPLAQQFMSQLVRKNGLLFMTPGANADHRDHLLSWGNGMS